MEDWLGCSPLDPASQRAPPCGQGGVHVGHDADRALTASTGRATTGRAREKTFDTAHQSDWDCLEYRTWIPRLGAPAKETAMPHTITAHATLRACSGIRPLQAPRAWAIGRRP
jgi:hypothetical protein